MIVLTHQLRRMMVAADSNTITLSLNVFEGNGLIL
jgi:hypothetical protein